MIRPSWVTHIDTAATSDSCTLRRRCTGTSLALGRRMRIGTLAFFVAFALTAGSANAGVPACPASLGGYVATVQGNDVVVCPTTAPPPGLPISMGCPFTLGLTRLDVATGATEGILGPCVADPQSDAGGDAGTPCYLDSCVGTGTYEYGYAAPPFAGCTEACAGPTSGEWAVVATVTATPSNCTPASTNALPAIWSILDAGVQGGAVPWSGTCTGPLPGPDGGLCAWEFLDGLAQWAPCPPDGGTLCPWYEADGAVIPLPCPAPADAGRAGSRFSATSDGGGVADEAAGGGHGGSCSAATGVQTTSLGPLAVTLLALVLRARRRRSA